MTNLQQLQEEGDNEFIHKMCHLRPFMGKEVLALDMSNPDNVRNFLSKQIEKSFKAGQQDMLERVNRIIEQSKIPTMLFGYESQIDFIIKNLR
jgi:hypothetical protein